MATMVDVARRAGVSVATVSHVLNDTRPVRPATRQAVLDAIDELGYTPNTLARSLVTSRTRSIGLAVSAISNPYFTEILQGVEAGALERGYGLLIADPHDDPRARAQGRPAAARAARGRHDRRALRASGGAAGLPRAARRTDRVPGPAGRRPRTTTRSASTRSAPRTPNPSRSWSAHLAELGHRAHRPGRGPARAQHHDRADLRLPARPRVRRAPVRRTARGRTATPRRRPPSAPPTPCCPSRRRPPRSSPPTTR